jgi:hypothetical protein
MKNITLSADEALIEEARERAQREHTTLNEQFRRWLEEYARGTDREQRVERAMRTIHELQQTIKTRGPYTRDEMNER